MRRGGTGHGPDQRISLRRVPSVEKAEEFRRQGCARKPGSKKKFLEDDDGGNDLLIQVRTLKNGSDRGKVMGNIEHAQAFFFGNFFSK